MGVIQELYEQRTFLREGDLIYGPSGDMIFEVKAIMDSKDVNHKYTRTGWIKKDIINKKNKWIKGIKIKDSRNYYILAINKTHYYVFKNDEVKKVGVI